MRLPKKFSFEFDGMKYRYRYNSEVKGYFCEDLYINMLPSKKLHPAKLQAILKKYHGNITMTMWDAMIAEGLIKAVFDEDMEKIIE